MLVTARSVVTSILKLVYARVADHRKNLDIAVGAIALIALTPILWPRLGWSFCC
jgi:hypothetical protein